MKVLDNVALTDRTFVTNHDKIFENEWKLFLVAGYKQDLVQGDCFAATETLQKKANEQHKINISTNNLGLNY